jgi:hypothetical protein
VVAVVVVLVGVSGSPEAQTSLRSKTIITSRSIGPSTLGSARKSDVRAWEGRPRYRWRGENVESGQLPDPPVNFSGELWGYRCPGTKNGWPCMTLYGFQGNRLRTFSTQSTRFWTHRGTHVGSTLSWIEKREQGTWSGNDVQCPGFVFISPSGWTFAAQVQDGRVYGFYVSTNREVFGPCGS